MIRPPCSLDLNSIENLWTNAGKQYNSIDELWNPITIAANDLSKDSIKVLTGSVDNRLLSVIKRDGGYINH